MSELAETLWEEWETVSASLSSNPFVLVCFASPLFGPSRYAAEQLSNVAKSPEYSWCSIHIVDADKYKSQALYYEYV